MDGNPSSIPGGAETEPVSRIGRQVTRRGVLATAPAIAAYLVVSTHAGAQDASTPVLDDPVATATELVQTFAQMVMDKDAAGLTTLLADNFVIQRVVGTTIGKEAYIDSLPDVGGFEILSTDAWQTENVLMASWNIQIDLILEDGTQLSPDPTPYLTTFIHQDGDWRVLAHANFGQVATDDEG